jgi:uncharacterized Tic20 family protein
MAMVLWLLHLVSTLVTLIVFLLKRKESQFIDWHGKQCLNLFVTHFLALCLLILVFAVGVGAGYWLDRPLLALIVGGVAIVLMIALLVFGLVLKIIAAIKAGAGERWQPPLCLRLFK